MRWIILFLMTLIVISLSQSAWACPTITINPKLDFTTLEIGLSIEPKPSTYQVMLDLISNETIIDRKMLTNLSIHMPRPDPGLYDIQATLLYPCQDVDKKSINVRPLKTLKYNGSQNRLYKVGLWLVLICACTLAITLVIRR